MNIRQALLDYIGRELLHHRERLPPSPDESLLDSAGGVLDSMSLIRLIDFIESHLGIRVDDLDVVPENFETLEVLVAFLERKKGTVGLTVDK